MDELKEAVIEAKNEEKKEDIEGKHEKVAKNLENIYAERLKQKAEELGKIEDMIDKKINDFKDFVSKTALSGKALTEQTRTAEQEKALKIDTEVQKWLKQARGGEWGR